MKSNSGQFKKGEHRGRATEFKKGNRTWNTGKKVIQITGENHPHWKGDKVGYTALHNYIRGLFPKPQACMRCKLVNSKLELSNISYEYKRVIEDWEWLCRFCHRKKDFTSHAAKVFEIKEYKKGYVFTKRKEVVV